MVASTLLHEARKMIRCYTFSTIVCCSLYLVFVTFSEVCFGIITSPILHEDTKIVPRAGQSPFFGERVALDGNLGVIVSGSGSELRFQAGTVDLYNLDTGQHIRSLVPDNLDQTLAFREYGNGVGIDGETILVVAGSAGAPESPFAGKSFVFDTTTGTVNRSLPGFSSVLNTRNLADVHGGIAILGKPDDSQLGPQAGAAILYDVNSGELLYELRASDGTGRDFFGRSVAINGNLAIVGSNSSAGAAYIFDVSTGQELHKLVPGDSGRGFGLDVDISGTTAVVAAGFGDGGYAFDALTGSLVSRLEIPIEVAGGQSGASIAVNGNLAVYGDPLGDAVGTDFGAAYVYEVSTGEVLATLVASDGDQSDHFGVDVAIGDKFILVGADLNNFGAGAAYVFARPVPEPQTLLLLASAAYLIKFRRKSPLER